MLTSPTETLVQTVEMGQLKLHALDLPAQFTGGTITIQKNDCIELRYFLSKSNDVLINLRDGIGGFYELTFQNNQHDYWKSKAKMDQNLLAQGAVVDLTEQLSHLRGRFGDNSRNYLYFFCPFIKVGVDEPGVTVDINLNKNPVELRPKEELNDEVWNMNHDLDPPKKPGVRSLNDVMQNIIQEIKGDGTSSGVKTRLEESDSNYFEVSLKEIDLIFQEDESDVKRVKPSISFNFVDASSG